MNKLVAGSIAILGAGAIAVTPVSSSPALIEAQHRAVEMVAAVTDSPADVYGDLFENTSDNLSYLGTALFENPFPVLSQISENQTGYAQSMGTAVQAGITQLQTWYETGVASNRELAKSGKTYIADAQTAIEAGDYAGAYNNINRFVLFGLMASLQPIYTEAFTIPPQMAQNFANAVSAVSNSGTLVFGLFQSVFAPVSGLAFEISNIAETISKTEDPAAVFNVLVNTPGVLADAVLNGFDYNNTDDATTEVGSWAGLISHLVSSPNPNGGRDIVSSASGPLEQLLQTIPKKIAAAIDNSPEVPEETVTGATALNAGVDTIAPPAAEATTEDGGKVSLARSLAVAPAAAPAVEEVVEEAPAADEEKADNTPNTAPAKTTVSQRLNELRHRLSPKKAATSTTSATSESSSASDSDSSTGASNAKAHTKTKTKKHAKKDRKKSTD